jgi:hypothetical protein
VSENDYNSYQKQIMSRPQIDSEAPPLKAGLTLQGWTEAFQLYREKNEEKLRQDEIDKVKKIHAEKAIDTLRRQKVRDDKVENNRQNKDTDTAGSHADNNAENAKESPVTSLQRNDKFDEREMAKIEEKVKSAPEDMERWYNKLNNDANKLSLELTSTRFREKLEDSRKDFETEANHLLEKAKTLAEDFDSEKGLPHYQNSYDSSQKKWDRLWKTFRRTMAKWENHDNREERKVIPAPTKIAEKTPRRTLRNRLLQSLKNHPNSKDISRALYCSCAFCSRGSGLK